MTKLAYQHNTARAALVLALLGFAFTGCDENLTMPPERADYTPEALQPLSCVPNLDGKIDASELQETLGVPVSLLVSPAGETRGVDLAGATNGAGTRIWDWSSGDPTDRVAQLEASGLEGKWYAARFPQGQFVTPVDLGGRVEGIYRRDADGLYLLGLASAEESPAEGQTLFVYQDPVALFRFPLEVGKEWVSTGVVRDAKFRGLPYAGRDVYAVKVEASGELRLPELTFEQVLMVRTKVSVEPAVGQAATRQQVSFLFECFGEVARATSLDGEDAEFFESASEVRRLGIGL